jgi:hypothetical protein
MKVHYIYFHDLKPSVQEKIAKAHGYESAEEYIIETNDEVNPLAIVDIYDKDEMME